MPLKPTKSDKVNDQLDHERLNSLINSMGDAVIAVDEKINVVLYNAAALDLFDMNNIKKNSGLNKIFRPVDKNHQSVDLNQLIEAAKTPTSNRDLLLAYSDGSFINLYISIAPVHLGYGIKGHKGFVVLLRDITREKSLEEERDEFISVVSHELRTPIAISEGNIGNAEFIVEKSGDLAAVKKALKEAHNQINFLADMINDLATLSRAERGVLVVEPEKINIHEMVTELVSNYTPQAQVKNLKLNCIIDPKLSLLNSSRLYVREILQNIVTNSIKYTEKGRVSIKVSQKPEGAIVTVADTGIGISKGDQERVFDRFFRSEDYRTRSANGTGLGLYVTMKLARLIHAEISLKSELNKGSTFTIKIPNLK